jgi:hypothetical protein
MMMMMECCEEKEWGTAAAVFKRPRTLPISSIHPQKFIEFYQFVKSTSNRKMHWFALFFTLFLSILALTISAPAKSEIVISNDDLFGA